MKVTFNKHNIYFSKRQAAKLVGGETRLEKLIISGKIRMDKPTAKQNGKWFCNASDLLDFIRL
ncbi:MAG: hypothetical protein K2K88_09850 [Muribaculaceae bacterium]|nr:hypothetical protein [Muribaculaceae bacterium]MDE6642540.1 hypothetical protein [Muribaculaceae bacterium]